MKRVLQFLFVIIMVLPVFVFATSSNYDDSIGRINNYIKSDKYRDRDKYLIMSKNTPYSFSTAGISNINSRFETGGMLNTSEYNLSLINDKTYLATGIEYWTMTGNSSSHYYVENYLKTKEENLKSNVRVTEHVKSEVKVTGSGTYTNPWVFDARPIVTIRTNSETYGLIDNRKVSTRYAEGNVGNYHVSFVLKPASGFEYAGHDGCRLTTTGSTTKESTYKINNIITDMDCTARFDSRTFKLTLKTAGTYSKKPSPEVIYFKYLTGWSTNSNITSKVNQNSKILTTLPTRGGYSFEGYKYGTTEVIDKNGNLKQGDNSTIFNSTDTNNIDLTAQWSECPVGTYSDSAHATCQTCPSGYTSRKGADSINKCYISVEAGHYLGTANEATKTECSNGYYKAAHEVNYGSVSACTRCPAGYRDGTALANKTAENKCLKSVTAGNYVKKAKDKDATGCGKGTYKTAHTVTYGGTSTCDNCPDGYKDGSGTTAQSNCSKSVSAGNYVKNANDKDATSCGNGTYKAAHTVTYGGTSSCTNCPDGYRDGSATTAESNCSKSVSGGYKVATAKGSASKCAAGTYKAAHTVKYGKTSSCASCPANTYSLEGASSCTNCPSGQKSDAGSSSCTASNHCPSECEFLGRGGCNCKTGVCDCFCPQRWGTSAAYWCYVGGWNDDGTEAYMCAGYGMDCS